MVSKIPTVELQLNANVVANVNDPVELTANLSDLELEQIERSGRRNLVRGGGRRD